MHEIQYILNSSKKKCETEREVGKGHCAAKCICKHLWNRYHVELWLQLSRTERRPVRSATYMGWDDDT